MLILLLFAFLAGIITVLSPCVLPILPILLAAGAGQGKYRPLGIILGVVISFTFFTLSLAAIIRATGLSANGLRYTAIGLIVCFGLMMIFPRLGLWFEQFTARIASLGNKIQTASTTTGTGFWSGFILGIALGLIWTPCAGPILATVTTLVALNAITFTTVLITLAYSLGSALPMFAIVYGSSTLAQSITGISVYSNAIRTIFGLLMLLSAAAIALHADVVLQQFTARYFPTIIIEDNPQIRTELEQLRKASSMNFFDIMPGSKAPEFAGNSAWINTQPLTIEQLRGKVVLIDFWTYSCINCIRTLPYIKKWYADYKDKGLVIVGVHTPEFEFEKSLANVQEATKRFNIPYPVALDNDYQTWQNYNNHAWPAHYLIDQQGIIRDIHLGEGEYTATENNIRALLGLSPITEKEITEWGKAQTPEIYLGYSRGTYYHPDIALHRNQDAVYGYNRSLGNDRVGLRGKWLATNEFVQSKDNPATLDLNFIANRVYLVMTAAQQSTVTVLLDGKPLPEKYYTADMNTQGQLMVQESRMYDVLDLKGDHGRHVLTLQVPNGVSLYAFTFGGGEK